MGVTCSSSSSSSLVISSLSRYSPGTEGPPSETSGQKPTLSFRSAWGRRRKGEDGGRGTGEEGGWGTGEEERGRREERNIRMVLPTCVVGFCLLGTPHHTTAHTQHTSLIASLALSPPTLHGSSARSPSSLINAHPSRSSLVRRVIDPRCRMPMSVMNSTRFNPRYLQRNEERGRMKDEG